ncbi:MAG: hypothetical protein QXM75_04340 [Candidatus Diapherotrites archaeon]
MDIINMGKTKYYLFIAKCSYDLNSLMPKINKCLYSALFFALVPLNTVISKRQILSAAEKALRSYRSKSRRARELSKEFLVYLYATPNIKEALNITRYKSKFYVIIILCENYKRLHNCLKKQGIVLYKIEFKPKLKELLTIYKEPAKLLQGKKTIRALELATIERQTLLLAGLI